MSDERARAMPKTVVHGENIDGIHGTTGKLVAPAAERNLKHILELLDGVLNAPRRRGKPARRALELASGTGQHIIAFANAFPEIVWQPSDIADDALRSIDAWREDARQDTVLPARAVDLMIDDWHGTFEPGFSLMIAVNLIHIAPWQVTENLLAGAARLLDPDGRLVLYSPMIRHGDFVSDGNRTFDQSLREQDVRWGLRDIADLEIASERHGLVVHRTVTMPANNTALLLGRTDRESGTQSPSSS